MREVLPILVDQVGGGTSSGNQECEERIEINVFSLECMSAATERDRDRLTLVANVWTLVSTKGGAKRG